MRKQIFSVFVLLQLIYSIQSFEYDVEISRKLAAYSLASYCNLDRLSNWSCKESCDRVEPLKDFIIYKGDQNTLYLMGYDDILDAITIIARGTVPWSITNWKTDIKTEKVDYPKCSGCQVHKGFYQALQIILQQLKSDFLKLKQKYPNSKIFVTGQSLGGALATLIVPEIYEFNGKKPLDAFYTYGSPRVGNSQFSQWYSQNNYFSRTSARVTNNKDIVVQIPTHTAPCFYTHIGHEVFYKSFKNEYQYTMCEHPEDANCSEGEILAVSVKDHGGYFDWNWAYEIFTC
ncbi:hypothetical protein ABPG74_022107 [Tetrahymena malaccensis]